jgi:aconitase A
MTKSTGTSGLILLISPPTSFIALRNDAKSTTADEHIKALGNFGNEGNEGEVPFKPSRVILQDFTG